MILYVIGRYRRSSIGKPHPIALRERVVAFVDEGNGHREAARHFRVSPKFVNDMMKLRRETGGLSPKRQGHQGRAGKLRGYEDWVRERLSAQDDLTPIVGRVRGHRAVLAQDSRQIGKPSIATTLGHEPGKRQPPVAIAAFALNF